MQAFQRLYDGALRAALIAVLAGCGAKGSGGSGGGKPPSTEPPPVPPPSGAMLTSVGMDGMGYRIPPLSSCLKRTEDGHRLPVFAAGAFKADGDLTEWAGIATLLPDTLGDADSGADVALASAATADADLALMIQARPADGVSLGIEFGEAYLRHGELGGSIILRLRIYKGALERFLDGAWRTVPVDLGALAVNGGNFEVRLGRGLVGEALTYPAWSLRVFSRDEATGTTRDSTHAAFFSSWLDPDKPQFVLSTCKEWYTQHQPIGLVEIREADPASAWVDGPQALAAAQERVSQLGRLAIDAAVQAFPLESAPVLEVPVFESLGAVASAAFGEPYAAVAIDLAPFASSGTDAFPDGPVFKLLAARVLDLYLLELFPAADPGLRQAVNGALMDHLVRDTFGLSYFFDAYRGTLAAGNADVVAWGHVLGGVLTTAQLVDAWKQLAAGATPAAVFGDVTLETSLALTRDTDHDGLPDHYEAVYGTDPRRQDSDGDSWSDLAEVVNSEDPLAHTRQPNRIMPDGNFDDWLTLFPQKVHLDEGHSTVCPVAADIDFYAALASRDELMIGAVAREFWDDEPRASWEAVIDLPLVKRQFLVSVPSDSYATTIKDPETGKVLLTIERAFPQGRKTVEWVIRRQELKLESFFDEPDSVRIRIRTLFHDAGGKDNYCDETAWFAPYVTR